MKNPIDFYIGFLEYFLYPRGRAWWGPDPLNGQVKRRELVDALVKRFEIRTVVETGTCYGATTNYFSNVIDLDTVTIENNARFAGFCTARFRRSRKAKIIFDDSRSALRRIIPELVSS